MTCLGETSIRVIHSSQEGVSSRGVGYAYNPLFIGFRVSLNLNLELLQHLDHSLFFNPSKHKD